MKIESVKEGLATAYTPESVLLQKNHYEEGSDRANEYGAYSLYIVRGNSATEFLKFKDYASAFKAQEQLCEMFGCLSRMEVR